MSINVGIDKRWMKGNHRGMGYFANHIINQCKCNILDLSYNSNSIFSSKFFTFFKIYPIWEQIFIPILCIYKKIDILICPYNTGPLFLPKHIIKIGIVCDLIYLYDSCIFKKNLSLYQRFGRTYRRFVVPICIHKYDHILTISNFTQKEIIKYFNISPSKITVVHVPIDDIWFNSIIKYSARKNYIFTVSGEAPSKNLFGLLKAFSIVCKRYNISDKLIVAGVNSTNHSSVYVYIRKLEIEERVLLLDYIDQSTLINYYKFAKAFVFASFFEGFGIPIIESLSSGTRVACSNTTSMPEVVSNNGLLFNPHNVDEISNAILALINQKPKDSDLYSLVTYAKKFSLSVMNKEILNFWSKILCNEKKNFNFN